MISAPFSKSELNNSGIDWTLFKFSLSCSYVKFTCIDLKKGL